MNEKIEKKTETESSENAIKTKLKEKFIELSSASTSHGFPNMFRTKHWPVRVMWLIFFLVSTGLCIFMVYRSVNDYLSYDVVNKIRDFSELPMVYPVITFCNVNPFINEENESFIKKFLPITFNVSFFQENYDLNQTASENDTYTNEYYAKNIEANFLTLKEAKAQALIEAMNPENGDVNRKKLGYPLKEILLNCLYNEKPCNTSDFTWTYLYDFGNCYQFNTGKDETGNSTTLKKSFIAGNKNGLYLELYSGEAESIYSLQPDSGLIAFIHNQSSKPVPSEGIRIQPHSLTSIVLKKVLTQRQPHPYSNCQDLNSFAFDKTLHNVIIDSGSSYKQKLCFDLCLQQIIINKCGCYDLKYLKVSNAAPCLNLTKSECANTEYLNFINNDINDMCSKFCPLECESQYFEYTISNSRFPTQNYLNILNTNPALAAHSDLISEANISANTLALKIYFENLQYTLISESPKTSIFDIVANVGGTRFY